MPLTTEQRIEHKLHTAQAIIHRAALEAESLRDQGLADELHSLSNDLTMRLLPAVRRGQLKSAAAS